MRAVLATRSFAYLAAILSFAYIQRGQLFGIPFTFLELALLATLLSYVVEKLVRRERFPNPRHLPYFWPLLLLLLAATVAVLVAPDRRAAAGIWKAYFVEPILIAYVLADILRSRWELERFIGGFFISGILVSVFNILFFVYAVAIHRPNLIEIPPVAIYTSANSTGLFLGPLLALAAAMLLFGNRAECFRAGFFAAFALPAFVLSFSRGAWLGLLAALIFLAWHHRRGLRIAGAIVLAVIGVALIPSVRQRIAHEFDPTDPFNTINLRRNLWSATLRMMESGRHPLVGTGLSGFKHDIAPYAHFSGYSEDLIYPHNLFLNFWSETGLLGLAAVTWVLIEWVRRAAQGIRSGGPRHVYHLGIAAAGITILVHGMLDVPFFKNDLAFLTMSLIGVQVAALRQDERGPAAARPAESRLAA
jgi:O-antigen ligase